MSREASAIKREGKEDRKKVFERALAMASGTLTSRILGLFRDMAMAALFDRVITDAWAAAFRVPNLFRRLLGEGSLSVSFIPVFMQISAEDPSGVRARNLVNAVYTVILILVGAVTVFGLLGTESLLGLLLSNEYQADPAKWELTVRLARIMMGFVFFVSQYAFFMGLLNALGSFALPAAAPALLNVAMLIFTFLPSSLFGQAGDQLAWGVLVGGFAQAAILMWALRIKNYLPVCHFRATLFQQMGPELKKVFLPVLPNLLGTGLSQVITLVNLYFASSLAVGAISYIYWADRLLELPLALVAVSLGTATLPLLSELAVQKQYQRLGVVLSDQILMSSFFALPAAGGLYFLARPIVEVLFMRGEFSVVDAAATADVLRIYALSLLVISGARVLGPGFYAFQKNRVPTFIALAALGLHVGLAPFLMQRQGLQGLVLSSLIAMSVQFFSLLAALPFLQVGLPWGRTLRELAKMVIALGVLIAAVQVYDVVIRQWGDAGAVRTVSLFTTIALGGMMYLLAAAMLRVEIFETLVEYLRVRIWKK